MVPKGYLRPLGAPAAGSGEDAAAASEPDEIVAAAVARSTEDERSP